MKFKIREGFVANVSDRVEVAEDKFETQTQTFYPGKTIELTAEQAREHSHKLEPVDKAASDFLQSLHIPGPESSVQVDIDKLVAEKVAAAVAAALAGTGKAAA